MSYCKCPPKITDKCERCGEKERWAPKYGETYYCPEPDDEPKYFSEKWDGNELDNLLFSRNLVCKTKEEAIALAEKMLKAVE